MSSKSHVSRFVLTLIASWRIQKHSCLSLTSRTQYSASQLLSSSISVDGTSNHRMQHHSLHWQSLICCRGVKKPLNPILGETFTCYWDFPDKTRGYYISEQTSHHPPKSSYFYMAPEHNIRIDGCLKPRSKFLGNSAASLMEGIAILRFTNRGKNPKGES